MSTKPVSKSDLKARYPIVLRISLIINLLVIILLLVLIPKLNNQRTGSDSKTDDFTVVKIPIVRPPEEMAQRPKRPSIPLEAPDDELVKDVTLEPNTDLTIYEPWPDPPSPEEDAYRPIIPFKAYDKKPEPIGGYSAILKNAVYPEIARDAGISGTILVVAYIDEYGNVGECRVVQGIPKTGLDEAAINAVKKTKFYPAKQRDISVGVYIVIPIEFRLD